MRALVLSAFAATLLVGSAVAQTASSPPSSRASNLAPSDTSTIAPNLPAPPVTPDSPPSAFLLAAQNALAAGRTGEAQQALEMAQTRMLARSVPLLQTGVASDHPGVRATSAALSALGAGDRAGAMQQIGIALQTADATGR